MKGILKILAVAAIVAAAFGAISCSDDDDDDDDAKVVYTFTGTNSEAGNLTLNALDDGTYSISSDKIGTAASGSYDASNLNEVKFTETRYYDLTKKALVSGSKEQTVDAHEGSFTYESANGISVGFTMKE